MLLRKHMYNVSNEIRNHMVHYKPLTIEPYQDLDTLAHLDWSVDISDDLLDPSNIAEARLCPMCPTCPTCPTCPSFICPQCPTCPTCPVCPICQQQTDCTHYNDKTTTHTTTNHDTLLFGGVGILIGSTSIVNLTTSTCTQTHTYTRKHVILVLFKKQKRTSTSRSWLMIFGI